MPIEINRFSCGSLTKLGRSTYVLRAPYTDLKADIYPSWKFGFEIDQKLQGKNLTTEQQALLKKDAAQIQADFERVGIIRPEELELMRTSMIDLRAEKKHANYTQGDDVGGMSVCPVPTFYSEYIKTQDGNLFDREDFYMCRMEDKRLTYSRPKIFAQRRRALLVCCPRNYEGTIYASALTFYMMSKFNYSDLSNAIHYWIITQPFADFLCSGCYKEVYQTIPSLVRSKANWINKFSNRSVANLRLDQEQLYTLGLALDYVVKEDGIDQELADRLKFFANDYASLTGTPELPFRTDPPPPQPTVFDIENMYQQRKQSFGNIMELPLEGLKTPQMKTQPLPMYSPHVPKGLMANKTTGLTNTSSHFSDAGSMIESGLSSNKEVFRYKKVVLLDIWQSSSEASKRKVWSHFLTECWPEEKLPIDEIVYLSTDRKAVIKNLSKALIPGSLLIIHSHGDQEAHDFFSNVYTGDISPELVIPLLELCSVILSAINKIEYENKNGEEMIDIFLSACHGSTNTRKDKAIIRSIGLMTDPEKFKYKSQSTMANEKVMARFQNRLNRRKSRAYGLYAGLQRIARIFSFDTCATTTHARCDDLTMHLECEEWEKHLFVYSKLQWDGVLFQEYDLVTRTTITPSMFSDLNQLLQVILIQEKDLRAAAEKQLSLLKRY
jgi:hypothetical protein